MRRSVSPLHDTVFPSITKGRIIVADAFSPMGLHCVESLLVSPFVVPDVVLGLAPSLRANLNDPAVESAANEVVNELRRQYPSRQIKTINFQETPLGKDDVLLYASAQFRISDFTTFIQTGIPSDRAPRIALLTTEDYSQAAGQAMKAIAKYRAVWVSSWILSPPAQRALDVRRLAGLSSSVEHLCSGIALGVTRFLGVNASTPADIVPIDYAINSALASLALVEAKRLPTTLDEPNHVRMSIVAPRDQSLVWGMVGEYIIDYYGRFDKEIARSMPPDTFQKDASLAFNAHFPDLWNYGISLTAPIDYYRAKRSFSTKSHLAKYPHSTTAARMKSLLSAIDQSLDSIEKMTAARRADVSNDGYLMLRRVLGADPQLMGSLMFIDLHCVPWEMYIKAMALDVLRYVARSVMGHAAPLTLPTPQPIFHQDLIFVGEDKLPPPNFNLRKWFQEIHFMLRGGQQANGLWVPLKKGRTSRRFHEILAQPHVRLLMSKMAKEENTDVHIIEERAIGILRGIGDELSHQSLRTLALSFRRILRQIFDRINMNPEALDYLHLAFRQPKTAVILMPSHRSYMDFLVMSYVLLSMGHPLPHICSGEDFLRMGLIADLLRGSGAFFMRRSFKSDKLYSALFREYVRHLTRDSQCIEFFIEGTRSRSQKTLSPKLGILKMITDSYLEPQEEINDVLIVPIALSYEKVLEGNVYADELVGVPKPKETTGNLLKSATVLRQNFGQLNINVAKPISLAGYVRDPLRQSLRDPTLKPTKEAQKNLVPPAKSELSNSKASGFTPSGILSGLAHRITQDLQNHIIVTPTSLVASALLAGFDPSEVQAGVGKDEVSSTVEWIRHKVLMKGGKLGNTYATLEASQLLSVGVKHLAPHAWVSRLSHVFVGKASIATQMILSMYTNQLIHLFATDAIFSISAFAQDKSSGAQQQQQVSSTSGVESTDQKDDAPSVAESDGAEAELTVAFDPFQRRVAYLRTLLGEEFPAFLSPDPVDREQWFVQTLEGLHVALPPSSTNKNSAIAFRKNQYTNFCSMLVYPLIDSYWVLALSLLLLNKEGRVTEASVLDVAHIVALALFDKKLVRFVQSCNKETLKNASTVFLQRGISAVEKAPSVGLVLRPAYRENNAAMLHQEIDRLNELRWRPLTAEQTETAKSILFEVRDRRSKERAAAVRGKPKPSKL